MGVAKSVNNGIVRMIRWERSIDPYIRPAFDFALRRPLSSCAQAAIRKRRPPEPLGLAEEHVFPEEDEAAEDIVATMSAFLHQTYDGRGPALRAGNTKTYGVVSGRFEVLPFLASNLRKGLFAEPRTYPAWVRFAGPGPLAPPDMDDNGVLSIGVKVIGVAGPKLLDERTTQDFTGISAPTFTTPTVMENVRLQKHILDGTPVLYFLGPRHHHLLDGVMQALYSKTQHNPVDVRYWSCSSYLLGEGQAMHYSLIPRQQLRTPVPRHPSPDYLREAMANTLASRSVEFDFCVQLQSDPMRMPIEDDGIEWPERLSPFVVAARLVIPKQHFTSPEQLAFADNLSFNPWHCIAEHRPLGNQNRARRTIYKRMSDLRQAMNRTTHIEPTGEELFETEAR